MIADPIPPAIPASGNATHSGRPNVPITWAAAKPPMAAKTTVVKLSIPADSTEYMLSANNELTRPNAIVAE